MDVSNAFLHGDLGETVYLKPPLGCSCPPHMVCQQAGRRKWNKISWAWFEKFRCSILTAHFCQSQSDHSLFIRRTSNGCTILLLYVDDIIISGNDVIGIATVKSYLLRTFKMKDLGELTYFLGLEIKRTPLGIYVHQRKYPEDLLSMAGFSAGRTADTSMELNLKLRKDDGSLLSDATLYR